MRQYQVRIEERTERVVTVEATTQAEARAMAERGPGAWLDAGPAASLGVEALEVAYAPIEGDPMEAWHDYRESAWEF